MFKKILIANRGEIAVRIIRACRDMGIISTAVYSTADRDAMHTNLADESLCIGSERAADSYLNMNAIITAAKISGAEAIHPGYGFLSENEKFAKLCEDNGIIFIGPASETISLMGNKIAAKRMMKSAGVPTIPGSENNLSSLEEAMEIAEKIGYPVLLKASNGGGGRGIRIVNAASELKQTFDLCRAEAVACFGDGSLYLEKYLLKPRHIEIQILADGCGNAVSLFERDCSLQRRHQKIIEEAPSVFLNEALRTEMCEVSVRAVRAAKYRNAGTIEYLVDADKNFYFMEMNTRIQVEHPVTEMITGIDLICAQIKIASGIPLWFTQDDLKITGHAIECRINAEDATKNFTPCPGTLSGLNVPGGPGVRVDSAVYQGYTITPYYDSLISKLIVHGKNRNEAIDRMRRALAEYLFEGLTTNTDYHLSLLADEDYLAGNTDIDFIERLGVNKNKRN